MVADPRIPSRKMKVIYLHKSKYKQLKTKKHTNGKEYPYAPEKDKIIFDGETLTKYINWKLNNK